MIEGPNWVVISIEPIGFSTHAQQHNQAKIKVTTSKQVANDAPKVPEW